MIKEKLHFKAVRTPQRIVDRVSKFARIHKMSDENGIYNYSEAMIRRDDFLEARIRNLEQQLALKVDKPQNQQQEIDIVNCLRHPNDKISFNQCITMQKFTLYKCPAYCKAKILEQDQIDILFNSIKKQGS